MVKVNAEIKYAHTSLSEMGIDTSVAGGVSGVPSSPLSATGAGAAVAGGMDLFEFKSHSDADAGTPAVYSAEPPSWTDPALHKISDSSGTEVQPPDPPAMDTSEDPRPDQNADGAELAGAELQPAPGTQTGETKDTKPNDSDDDDDGGGSGGGSGGGGGPVGGGGSGGYRPVGGIPGWPR